MVTVSNDTTTDNVSADEAQGTPTGAPDNALPEPTEAEAKKIAEIKSDQDELVDLAVATLDPKDMLKKYCRLGAKNLSWNKKRKASLAPGAWNGKEDFEKGCDQTADLIRMRAPIKEIRMGLYTRVYLWVEAVKPLVPNVEKLSYFQVANKFVQTLSFDMVNLTGEIKKDWLTWTRETVEQQLSDKPLTLKELDAAIEERKAEIELEKKARDQRTPEQVLAAEQKAANRKLTAQRSAAQSKVSNAVADALTDKHADVNDIVAIVRQVVEKSPESIHRGIVVFEPESISVDECKQLAAAMFAAGKLIEMKFLRDNLDRMVKIAENALITSKSA